MTYMLWIFSPLGSEMRVTLSVLLSVVYRQANKHATEQSE